MAQRHEASKNRNFSAFARYERLFIWQFASFPLGTYIEIHELGIIDTALQCGLVIVRVLLIAVINEFKNKLIKKIFQGFGSISYELYLSHGIATIYFYNNPDKILLYLMITVVSAIVLYFYHIKIAPKLV